MRRSSPNRLPFVLSLLIAVPATALAERPAPMPVYELGLGVEHVWVEAPGANSNAGFGGLVFLRGSVLAWLFEDAFGDTFMFGDYLGVGIGGWYGNEAHLRLPLELGVQAGLVVASEFQVVIRGGIMGVGGFGGLDGGGYGAAFGGARVKWERFAGELQLAPRVDSEEGGFAGVISATGRFFLTQDFNLGVRFTNAERSLGAQSGDTAIDRSVLVFLAIET